MKILDTLTLLCNCYTTNIYLNNYDLKLMNLTIYLMLYYFKFLKDVIIFFLHVHTIRKKIYSN
jgi:hypothetical protein